MGALFLSYTLTICLLALPWKEEAEANNFMHKKFKHILLGVLVSGGGLVSFYVVLTVVSLWNPFPFSTCLAPWWTSNRYTCVVEAARRMGRPALCDNFNSDIISRLGCVTAVAIFQENPNICIGSLFLEKNLTRDADTFLCLSNFQQGLRRADLCEEIADMSWKESCFRVYSEVTGQPADAR